MRKWLNIFHCHGEITPAERLIINLIRHYGEALMAKQTDLAAQIDTLTGQVDKIGTETTASLAEIETLKAQIADLDNVSPELQASVDRLSARIKAADDLVQDATAPTTP